MLRAVELLKNKQVVKKAATFSTFGALVSVIAMAASLKLGINKWKIYNDPITWSELFLRIPRVALATGCQCCEATRGHEPYNR